MDAVIDLRELSARRQSGFTLVEIAIVLVVIGYQQNIYNLSGNVAVFGDVPGGIARILESRGDDGVTNAGSIQGHASQSGYNTSNLYKLALSD